MRKEKKKIIDHHDIGMIDDKFTDEVIIDEKELPVLEGKKKEGEKLICNLMILLKRW